MAEILTYWFEDGPEMGKTGQVYAGDSFVRGLVRMRDGLPYEPLQTRYLSEPIYVIPFPSRAGYAIPSDRYMGYYIYAYDPDHCRWRCTTNIQFDEWEWEPCDAKEG